MKDINDLKQEKTLAAILEALLFIAVSPVSIPQLASSLGESGKNNIRSWIEYFLDVTFYQVFYPFQFHY